MAIKITKEEFEKKFGKGQTVTPVQSEGGFFSTIKSAAKQGVDKVKQSYGRAVDSAKQGNLGGLLENSLGIIGGASEVVGSPLAPVIEPTVGAGINYAADKISNNPKVQQFANSKAGEVTSRATGVVSNLNAAVGLVAGGMGGGKAGARAGTAVVEQAKPKIASATTTISNVARDVIPTSERIVNHQVTKALDLSAGDVKNISLSTGHEVGQFLAEKNLIRENTTNTQTAIKDFFKQNYDTVRSEIDKVKDVYKPNQVPRYVEVLKVLKKKVGDTPGLQKVGVEIENLLNKKDISLKDVQRVKELLDQHFSLYSKMGDVSEGITKQGLDTIRKDIKTFIETQVKEKTGSDIAELNNNVATSKGILDAVEARSTAGLTRSNLRIGDLGIFGIGMGMGGPLTGVALLFGKKLMESSPVRLRIAKFMDKVSDAKKAKIQAELEAGKIPEEFKQFIKKKR